jgi:hypothetical protein
MCKKLIIMISLVLVFALAGTNVVFGAYVVERQVNKSSDDSEEEDPGGDTEGLTSSDLEMPHEDPGTPATDKQMVGMRFEDIAIPKGSVILEAWVEFECDETDTGTEAHVSLIIEGELSPDAPTFTGSDFDIIPRPRTTAKVVWAPVPWTAVSQKDQTPNIAAVIQEIVNQDGWKSGNALVIIISDDPDNPSEGLRNAEAYDGEAANAPLLHIEFTSKTAMQPSPADGAVYEDTWASLSWTPGETAASHDVYFGENFDNVNDGTEGTFYGNQPSTLFIVGFAGMPYPDGLVPGTTYYWRIDEVEADGTTKHKGPVWRFTVPSKTAYDPDPPDGAKYIDTNVTLSWTPGYGGKLHTVYFGDNFDDVNSAAGELPQGVTTYTPGPLEMNKLYYWRVDEFDGAATHKGDVWSFKTLPIITVTDPNLIGWWTFDEGRGGTALDWSGYGNDGELGGNPQWVDGIMGGALDLSGDYVAIDGVVDDITSTNITVSAWVKTTQGGEGELFACNDSGTDHPFMFGVQGGNPYVNDGGDIEFPPDVNDDQWHMLTYVRMGSRGYIYVDGIQQGTYLAFFSLDSVTRWSIGQEWDDDTPSNFYFGLVDDARFYNAALTQTQVVELMRGDLLLAWNPSPVNNSIVDIDQAKQPLSWSPGDNASQHDVYFGTDKDTVANADTSDTSGIYRGRQAAVSYTPSEGLGWGSGPYYWRIDEYNTDGTISTGRIWSFTVADFLVVDDFESYNDFNPDEPGSNRIFLTWMDGYDTPTNGSVVGYADPPFCERSIVHSGGQSMPLLYNNSGPAYYSEATLPLSTQRDWTREDVKVLTLWLYGDPDNAPEPMYVVVSNAAGPSAVVYHDNPDATLVDTWTQWDINLEEIGNAGVTLTNVDSLAIGFGNRNNPQVGGSGMVFIDDIRLYRLPPQATSN